MTGSSFAAALVGPATDAAAVDIRDIRAPILFPDAWRWPLVVLAVAALAGLGIVAWRRIRARRARAMSPHERAREALRRAERLAREGQTHAWAELVAEAVRGGLAARLGADILPLTTRELSARAQTLPESQDALVVLHVCDLARFAMARPDVEALLAQTELARAVVEASFVVPASPPPPSPSPPPPQAPTQAPTTAPAPLEVSP